MTQYRALVGIDYPPNKRVEADEIVSDLPGNAIKWLLDGGYIEPLDGKSKKETKTEPKPDVITLSDGVDKAEAEVILETAETLKEGDE